MLNPKGVHEVNTSSSQLYEEIKDVITLRKGKEVNNKVEMSIKKSTTQILPLDFEESSPKEKEESSPREYVLKAPFPQRLVKTKKRNSTSEVMEIFKEVRVNIHFLSAIKQVSSYAKFLKNFCIKKKNIYVQKNAFLIKNISFIVQ